MTKTRKKRANTLARHAAAIIAVYSIFVTGIVSGAMEMAMADDCDRDESSSMFLRRMHNVETVSSDIALRLAEMLFIRIYGQEFTNEQLPLVVIDRGDRWEVLGREGDHHRLTTTIKKFDGRIVELVAR
jgi:hypothetical protein